jgi:phage portal protein, SPP1 gp6-like|nr:MAG TPA: portal protein [Caudoviricetes sp.]
MNIKEQSTTQQQRIAIETIQQRQLAQNEEGVAQELHLALSQGEVSTALELFEDNTIKVNAAIAEYETATHAVMQRPNKYHKGKEPYITEKLPRAWQKYINEVALFFLLNNPIEWSLKKGNDAVFEAFTSFLNNTRFNTTTREAKRLAGAETQAAKLYHLYRDEDNHAQVKVIVLSKSKGYDLYPLIDQYGTMVAFAVGYNVKRNRKSIQRLDIYTDKINYQCEKQNGEWHITTAANPLGKIPVIYFKQNTEWHGVEARILRDEMQDSKTADINNYFADPVAVVTADVVSGLPEGEGIGKVVRITGKDGDFRYIEPPTSVNMKESEKAANTKAILQDSFTPDFSFETLSGMGTLSGEALRRALILGYIKRNRNIEIYEALIDREKNLILSIMQEFTHVALSAQIREAEIYMQFAEPFTEDIREQIESVGNAVSSGVMSLETAINTLRLVDDPQSEIDRIKGQKEAPLLTE